MMTDITIGQFFPGTSPMHRMDPRVKICLTLFSIILLFAAGNFVSQCIVVLLILAGVLLSRVPIKLYLKSLKAVVFIVLFMAVLNLFYGTGEPLVEFWVFKITMNGIKNCVFLTLRILSLILASAVLTFTTSPTQLTDALERLLKPLSYLRVPVHEFAMMMTIALRFIPTLLEETNKIMSAQKARGADMESGGLIQRVKALIPILIPLFVSAFRRAYDLATAMESRCYHGGKGRTKMKQLKLGRLDAGTLVAVVLVFAVFLAANIMMPSAIVM